MRLLEDTTGSGRADKSTVFRDDFGHAEDGIGAGLLARKGNVYYTCIPDLYLLKDSKGTGAADVKKSRRPASASTRRFSGTIYTAYGSVPTAGSISRSVIAA